MRHFRLAAAFAVMWASACASLDPYAASARALSGAFVYPMWNAVGKDLAYSLSDDGEQLARSSSAFQSCVESLTKSYGAVAASLPREVRAAQLIDCMKSAGWELVLDQITVTS
jgi:hypothetical protein